MTRSTRITACALALALVGAACGGGDSDSSNRTRNAALNNCSTAPPATATAVADASTAVSAAAADVQRKQAAFTKAQKAYVKEGKRKPTRKTQLKKVFASYKKARIALQASMAAHNAAASSLALTTGEANCVVTGTTPDTIAPTVTVAIEADLAKTTDGNGAEIGAGDQTPSTTTVPMSTTLPSTTLAPTTTVKQPVAGTQFNGLGFDTTYYAGAASADGSVVVFAGSRRIVVTRDKTSSNMYRMGGRNDSAAVSPNGQIIAVGSSTSREVWISFNYGQSFTSVRTGATPLSLALNESLIFIGEEDGIVVADIDGNSVGKWRRTGAPAEKFQSISVSRGTAKTTAVYGVADGFHGVYRSVDGGASFKQFVGSELWTTVSVSRDGAHVAAQTFLGGVYVSDDYGWTWVRVSTPPMSPSNRGTIAIDDSGKHLIASNAYKETVSISNDGGMSWRTVSVNSRLIASYNYVFMSGDASVFGVVYTVMYTSPYISTK